MLPPAAPLVRLRTGGAAADDEAQCGPVIARARGFGGRSLIGTPLGHGGVQAVTVQMRPHLEREMLA